MHNANTLKTAVACALLGAAAVTAAAPAAHAQPKFDRKIAKYLADRAAGELGTLRGGYAMTDEPALVNHDSYTSLRAATALDAVNTGALERDLPPVPRTDIRVVYAG